MKTRTQRNLNNARRQFREANLQAAAKETTAADVLDEAADAEADPVVARRLQGMAGDLRGAANGQSPPVAERFEQLPLDALRPSATNPRQVFDAEDLADLVASVRAQGVVEPLIVRPLKGGERHERRAEGRERRAEARGADGPASSSPLYEIVAGERRYRAAREAGLATVPCLVRALTDCQVLEVQVVENELRSDLSPLDKAAGYQRLIDAHGYTVEDIARRVGRSRSTVHGLLKVAALPARARTALAEGTLPLETAKLLARVPSAEDREKAAAYVLAGRMVYHPAHWQSDPLPRGQEDGPLSFREARELVRTCCMVELKAAPFSRTERELVAGVPDCESCPKRVGNLAAEDPGSYEGCRADVCTDPGCFRAKVEAWQQRIAAEAQKDGARFLSAKEAERVFRFGDGIASDSGYVDLAAPCWEDTAKKQRTYRQLVGEDLKAETVLAFDRAGKLRRLVPRERAEQVLRTKHKLKVRGSAASGRGRPRSEVSPAERKQRQEEKVRTEVNRRCMAEIVKKAERAWDLGVGTLLITKTPLVEAVRAIVPLLADGLWGDLKTAILHRRGLKGGHHQEKEKAFRQLAEDLDGPGLFGLLCELGSARNLLLQQYSGDGQRKQLLEAFEVDRKAIERQVRQDQAAKAAKKSTAEG